MYLMYADESGDAGLPPPHGSSQTQILALSGVVIHENSWRLALDQLIAFRRAMRDIYGLRMSTEIHAARWLSRHMDEDVRKLGRQTRLSIIKQFADKITTLPNVNIINVVVDKRGMNSPEEVFTTGWERLIQRFENTLQHKNFPGPRYALEGGLIFPDNTDGKLLIKWMRKMRRHNPVPNIRSLYTSGYRNMRLQFVLEDPNFRDSVDSYFVQAADTAAFLLYQYHHPSNFMRKTGGKNYLLRLRNVLCLHASPRDPLGVVRHKKERGSCDPPGETYTSKSAGSDSDYKTTKFVLKCQ